MNEGSVNYYGAMADKTERDPYGPDGGGRATVVNGRGFAKWRRFHSDDEIIWLEADGKMIGLTPWQAKVYDLGRAKIDDGGITLGAMAKELGCATSTVSRAIVKLMAWGLLGHIVGRGRHGGVLFFAMVKGDGFERFRQAAKAKVREWSRKANERVSRLWRNLAPYALEDRKVVYYDHLMTSTYQSARLREPWTPDDLRDAGII